MASKPVLNVLNKNATSVGMINWAIAEEGGYLAGAPLATNTTESIKQVGAYINAFQARQNQFLHALTNRIALAIVTSKAYKNPWQFALKGNLDYGETVEEIFVNMAKVENFKPDQTTNEFLADLFAKRKPDVRTAYHSLNFMKKYPVTVTEDQLRQAFTSMDGITNLVSYIVDSLYTRYEYDNFIMLKYMLRSLALDGKMYAVTIPDPSDASNTKEIVKKVQRLSDDMTFMKTKFNMANVWTKTDKSDQILIKTTKFDAAFSVDVQAAAFHLDAVTLQANSVLIDDIDEDENNMIEEILQEDPTFEKWTPEEIAEINAIQAFVIDRDFLLQYDQLTKMTEDGPFGNDLTWQYFLHHWACFSASPFKNAAVLTTSTPTITSVTATPETATVAAGSMIQLYASIDGSGLVDRTVKWSVVGDGKATVDRGGLVKINSDAVSKATITIKCESVADPSKYDTVTLTVA